MTIPTAIGAWRISAARALAWALLLAGWVGIAALADGRSVGSEFGFIALALWLAALGGWTWTLGRLRLGSRGIRALIIAAAMLAAGCWWPWHAAELSGEAPMLAGTVAFALVIACASMTVRAIRHGAAPYFPRPGPPFGPAAAGALLAWALLGDPSRWVPLAERLAIAIPFAALLLAALLPAHDRPARLSTKSGSCRAALFDCSLPGWGGETGQSAMRWPVRIAALLMLPMMCSLALTAQLCRVSGLPPQAMLGLHFGAMFAPALWTASHPGGVRMRAWACGPLLGLGAAALLGPAPAALIAVAIAHGAAWSLAWSVQLAAPRRATASGPSPLRAAGFNAACALALGLAVDHFGSRALDAFHVATGVAGAAAFVVAWSLRHRATAGQAAWLVAPR
jgi:hypothetical protein